MEKFSEKDISRAVKFYINMTEFLKDLEDALVTLIILSCMAIWMWISSELMPIFNLIEKYTFEPMSFFVFMIALAGGWLIIVRKIRKK